MRHERRRGLNVLVTGVGGPLGVSIFKALRQSALRPRIVATDADPMSVGLFRADAAYLLPWVTLDEAGYLERLEEICLAEKLSMVCIGSEIEMRRLAPHLPDFERHASHSTAGMHGTHVPALADRLPHVARARQRRNMAMHHMHV